MGTELQAPLRLTVDGLTFGWPGGGPSWGGWSATLSPGLTLVVGGDGAGKSTLLRLLATAIEPQAGELALHGLPGHATPLLAWPEPSAYRQHVFWCDPASDALDKLSAADYVLHHSQFQPRWSDALLSALLSDLGLNGHLHKPLLGLSMGMRRKLRLACALASGAALTLMDEPFAALDRHSAAVVSDMLADCAASTQRVFVSTAYEAPADALRASAPSTTTQTSTSTRTQEPGVDCREAG